MYRECHGFSRGYLLVAEYDGKIIGTSRVDLLPGKQRHVGQFSISVSKDYRGIGIGYCLATEIIKLARERFVASLRFIELSLFSENEVAFNLYKTIGFEKVAVIQERFYQDGKFMDEVVMRYYV